MKKSIILIFYIFLTISIGYAQNRKTKNSEPTIYKAGKIFVYQAKYDSAGVIKINYVVMRILPQEMYRGLVITYDYYEEKPVKETMDSLSSYVSRGFLETTTILEKKHKKKHTIWIHPPRSMYNCLTQYFPFPEISLPFRIRSYKSYFISFNDPLCHCTLILKYRMYHSHTQHLYQNKLINVCNIFGSSSNSKHGYFKVDYLFDEQLGFVRWTYKMNEISLELNLIDQF
jgi:hypothetical protein